MCLSMGWKNGFRRRDQDEKYSNEEEIFNASEINFATQLKCLPTSTA